MHVYFSCVPLSSYVIVVPHAASMALPKCACQHQILIFQVHLPPLLLDAASSVPCLAPVGVDLFPSQHRHSNRGDLEGEEAAHMLYSRRAHVTSALPTADHGNTAGCTLRATLHSNTCSMLHPDVASPSAALHPLQSLLILPAWSLCPSQVRLCLSSRSQDALHKALESLRQALPALKDTRPE
jgi:hypothetical protein